MNNSTKSLVAGALALGTPLIAQAESPHSFSANVGIFSDYLFRGISQTSNNPAIQGGIDYSYDSGTFADPYVGVWASNISFSGSIEADYYGGFAGEFSNGISWDVGGLYYDYPGAASGSDADYFEVYGSLGYTFDVQYEPTIGISYAYSPDWTFTPGSDDEAHWVNPSFGLSLPYGVGMSLSYGMQDVKNAGSYDMFSIGLSKDIGMFTASLDFVDTSSDCPAPNLCADSEFILGVSSSW